MISWFLGVPQDPFCITIKPAGDSNNSTAKTRKSGAKVRKSALTHHIRGMKRTLQRSPMHS